MPLYLSTQVLMFLHQVNFFLFSYCRLSIYVCFFLVNFFQRKQQAIIFLNYLLPPLITN